MYNLGRAAHQLGLSQIAMTLYEQALQVTKEVLSQDPSLAECLSKSVGKSKSV